MFKGVPMAGKTYDQATGELSCALTVTRGSDNATWAAAHAIAHEPEQGTCSLSLREVAESLDTGALKQFMVHGSVEGTLPAEANSSAEGSVTMHAAF